MAQAQNRESDVTKEFVKANLNIAQTQSCINIFCAESFSLGVSHELQRLLNNVTDGHREGKRRISEMALIIWFECANRSTM
jgi:hypothetical protein